MDFIFIQAPTYKQFTGDDGYEERPDAYMPENVSENNEDSLDKDENNEVLNGYLPHGGLFVAEELIRRGISVSLLQDTKTKIYKKLDETVTSSTIAIGISTMSGDMLRHAMDIAKYIREKYPQIPIIWGGAHPTAVRQHTLEHPLVDYIVWGEGEDVLPNLLDAISSGKDFEKIKGIGYKKDNKAIITERSEYISLDRVFDLPYHLLDDMNKFTRKMLIGGNRWLPLMTSRGCPFKCKFCHNTSTVYPMRLMRLHTLDHIVHNINKLIDDYDVDAIGFEDELTAANDKRIVEICNAIKSGVKRDLTYRITTRVDLLLRLQDSTLKLMRDTGFVGANYGVESGSQRVLDYMQKDITLDQVIEADERLNKFSFFKSFNFMLGLPTETIDEMKMSLSLLSKLLSNSKKSPYPCSQTPTYLPLPDTALFLQAQMMGFKAPENLEGWTILDNSDVVGSRTTLRPWLSEEQAEFTVMADRKVAETSLHFKGKEADHGMIDHALKTFEKSMGLQ